ncbi:MAG: hypothetical protein LBB29_03575, partial [Holosporaceae bacterium]|nr:hypothetical protein [Holosporaceae bacterium]
MLVNLADAPAIPEERKEISIIVPSSILQKNAAQIETPKKKLDYDKKNAESLDDYCYEEDPPTSDDYALSAYDVIARKLAGLGSDVDAEYAKFVRTKWKKLNENSLGLIRSWSRKHIVPLLNDCQTVFYPLGGPDMSCPFKFFPDAQTYILVGLEPIGNFQDISTNIQNPAIFKAMKEAFSWFLQNGFFLTSEMSKTLSSKSLNGTLYLILPQLTRLGFYVSNIEDLSITANGQEISRSKGSVDCVKITCRKDSDEAPRFIYYVRANLAEENPKLNNLLNFMKNRSFVTFLKSASYVFYCRTFTKFKTFLLANSKAILQDDTGIPFDSFGLKWQKHPFGIYTGPLIKVFKNYKQPTMADFYKNSDTVKIPFKIGYGFLLAKPSLLLAVQNKAIQSNKAESN